MQSSSNDQDSHRKQYNEEQQQQQQQRSMPPHWTNHSPWDANYRAVSGSTDSVFDPLCLPPASPLLMSSSDDLLFPTKLFHMLNDAHEKGFEDIVSWGSGPSSFNVHKKKVFEDQVLPKYFKMTKYKSFTRQLHNYDFKWIRGGPDKGGYCHKYFSRDGTNVDQLLSRKAIAGALANGMMPSAPSAPAPPSLFTASARRWSSPAFLSPTEEERKQPMKGNTPSPWSSFSNNISDNDKQSDRISGTKNDLLSISTHSGGYLLPHLENPFLVMDHSLSTSGLLGLRQHERSDDRNPFLNDSDEIASFGDSQQDFSFGNLLPTSTGFGTRQGGVGGLTTTMNDVHQMSSMIAGTTNHNAGTINDRSLDDHHDQLKKPPAHHFNFSTPLHDDVQSSRTMILDRKDLLVNLHEMSPSNMDTDNGNSKVSLDHYSSLKTSLSTTNDPCVSMIHDDDPHSALEPRTIEEMLEDKTVL